MAERERGKRRSGRRPPGYRSSSAAKGRWAGNLGLSRGSAHGLFRVRGLGAARLHVEVRLYALHVDGGLRFFFQGMRMLAWS